MDQSLKTTHGKGEARHRTWRSPRAGIVLGVLLLALAAFWRFLPQRAHQAVPPQPEHNSRVEGPAPVSVLAVSPAVSPQFLEVPGVVQPELASPIASKVMARVQSVLVREGDPVRRGQPLIRLDARDLDASVSQADANLRAARVGYDSARVSARMESSLSTARIAEAQSKVAQSEAALQAATAKLQLAEAGPRRQEREQAVLAVAQARSAFTLADSNLKRMTNLYEEGAISAQQHDTYRSQYEVARTQLETARQSQSIAAEGSRAEEIRAAEQAVRQAQAAVQEAYAGVKSAQASAMQAEVRKQEVQGAEAQIGQSQATLELAAVTRGYAVISSPFDGVVTKRIADPGAMATPGVPLLTVQGGSLRLEAVVPESALVSVRKDAAVPTTFDALGGRAVRGRVVEIAPQGDPSSHTFLVKIELPRGSGAAPGMFGRARFVTGAEKQLLVPAAALSAREGLRYLYVVDEHKVARLRLVTVGDPIGGRVPVLSGLNAGERIVIAGRDRLKDGMPVRVATR